MIARFISEEEGQRSQSVVLLHRMLIIVHGEWSGRLQDIVSMYRWTLHYLCKSLF